MRLGGQCFPTDDTPEAWVASLKRLGFTASFAPRPKHGDLMACVSAAEKEGIIVGEVGAFGNNPISPDEEIRRRSIAECQKRLALADEIGAKCCVSVAGSRAERWAAPHADNLTSHTFDLIVVAVREIIDAVKPTRTFFTLETMPWVYPHSSDSYLELIRAVDRDRFGVHLDPVNLICSPERYFRNADLLREAFTMLGPHIKSCHAKDIVLADKLTTHLDETRPGLGALDYAVFLRELNKLDPDTPLMLEHLDNEQEFAAAAQHIRSVAGRIGVRFR